MSGYEKMVNIGSFEREVALEGEPLARVGYDVAVPSFPGKGGRRIDPGSMRSCPMAVKKYGTGERRSFSALPVPGVL